MAQRFATPRQMEIGLGLLRIVTGIVFAAHGYQKWFTNGIPGTTGFFTSLGIPMPGIMAILVATLELGGGIALALGIFTRWITIPLAIDMAMAIIMVHAKNGFFVPKGVEFVTMLMTSAIALSIGGPGAFAVDGLFGRRTETRR
jgi:putative oxidoreductase